MVKSRPDAWQLDKRHLTEMTIGDHIQVSIVEEIIKQEGIESGAFYKSNQYVFAIAKVLGEFGQSVDYSVPCSELSNFHRVSLIIVKAALQGPRDGESTLESQVSEFEDVLRGLFKSLYFSEVYNIEMNKKLNDL